MISGIVDVEAMDLNVVGKSELPISRTDLDSCSNIFAVVRNYQIMGVTGRAEEVSSFTSDFDSTY